MSPVPSEGAQDIVFLGSIPSISACPPCVRYSLDCQGRNLLRALQPLKKSSSEWLLATRSATSKSLSIGDTFSRPSDAECTLDPTELLLVALERAGKITDREATDLQIQHLAEIRRPYPPPQIAFK